MEKCIFIARLNPQAELFKAGLLPNFVGWASGLCKGTRHSHAQQYCQWRLLERTHPETRLSNLHSVENKNEN
jgi:hypothetical protein